MEGKELRECPLSQGELRNLLTHAMMDLNARNPNAALERLEHIYQLNDNRAADSALEEILSEADLQTVIVSGFANATDRFISWDKLKAIIEARRAK